MASGDGLAPVKRHPLLVRDQFSLSTDSLKREGHLDQLFAAVDGLGGHGRGMGWLRSG
jgi:hypothetical protein